MFCRVESGRERERKSAGKQRKQPLVRKALQQYRGYGFVGGGRMNGMVLMCSVKGRCICAVAYRSSSYTSIDKRGDRKKENIY